VAYDAHSVLGGIANHWGTQVKNERRRDNGSSLLREVPEKGRDQEREAGDLEEQASCDAGHMPCLRDQGIPHRQSLNLASMGGGLWPPLSELKPAWSLRVRGSKGDFMAAGRVEYAAPLAMTPGWIA